MKGRTTTVLGNPVPHVMVELNGIFVGMTDENGALDSNVSLADIQGAVPPPEPEREEEEEKKEG